MMKANFKMNMRHYIVSIFKLKIHKKMAPWDYDKPHYLNEKNDMDKTQQANRIEIETIF